MSITATHRGTEAHPRDRIWYFYDISAPVTTDSGTATTHVVVSVIPTETGVFAANDAFKVIDWGLLMTGPAGATPAECLGAMGVMVK